MHNHKGRERKSDWITLSIFSFHTLEEPFLCANLWFGSEGEELKPFKFKRNMGALRRSPRGAKDDGNWFWFPKESILLLCWVANHLYQFGRVCLEAPQWWQKCSFFCWYFLLLTFLVLGFLVSFFSTLRGVPKIDLPLSKFSLAISVLNSLFSELTLSAGETNTIALEEVILGEEKSYPKPILSETAFWRLSISSSFALQVLSNWALTWNSSTSSFFVLSARILFSNRKALMVWFDLLHQPL